MLWGLFLILFFPHIFLFRNVINYLANFKNEYYNIKRSSISQHGWFNNIWILFVMLSFQLTERLLVFDWLVYLLLTSGGGGWNKTLELPPRCEVCVRQQPWCWVSQSGIHDRINYHKAKESLTSCFIIIISCKPLQSSFNVQFWFIDNGEWLAYRNIYLKSK